MEFVGSDSKYSPAEVSFISTQSCFPWGSKEGGSTSGMSSGRRGSLRNVHPLSSAWFSFQLGSDWLGSSFKWWALRCLGASKALMHTACKSTQLTLYNWTYCLWSTRYAEAARACLVKFDSPWALRGTRITRPPLFCSRLVRHSRVWRNSQDGRC